MAQVGRLPPHASGGYPGTPALNLTDAYRPIGASIIENTDVFRLLICSAGITAALAE